MEPPPPLCHLPPHLDGFQCNPRLPHPRGGKDIKTFWSGVGFYLDADTDAGKDIRA